MMGNKEKNENIQCLVKDCRYHANSQDYCTLDSIRVNNSGQASQSAKDTECGSFIAKEDNKFF